LEESEDITAVCDRLQSDITMTCCEACRAALNIFIRKVSQQLNSCSTILLVTVIFA